MKNLFTIFAILISYVLDAQQTGEIIDKRDGKTYKTVVIGSQTWMAENLNVSTFRNGDVIPEAKTNKEWIQAAKKKQPAWCYYNNDLKNGVKFGKLYNWYAVNDSRGLSPEDWHIPKDTEWKSLQNYLNPSAGKKMKSKNEWENVGEERFDGNNISFFSGLPEGFRFLKGNFLSIGWLGSWWSSMEESKHNSFNYNLSRSSEELVNSVAEKGKGLSVRCVKD
jgi:uncharacterized protein (TIGR02145 family)